ncbi:hypothetical protein NUK42_07680 [Aeromonas veronii]|uniref:hypothetical protein n=1 Tax=Aeromonas TaxID=642 RepID=UPI00214E8262|nr:hypothetical protein [Aeromonas veronii]MCR3958626.1 hypothetical protein [Aeromonas veronii]
MNKSPCSRLAGELASKELVSSVGNAQLIEIDSLLCVVLRWRREAAGHWGEEQGEI